MPSFVNPDEREIMRDKHLFWDVAPFLLLLILSGLMLLLVIQNERGWRVMQEMLKGQKELAEQNRALLNKVSELPRVTHVQQQPTPHDQAPNGGTSKPPEQATSEFSAGVEVPKIPVREYGDEKATDGDWLVMTLNSEPNSLNPLIDNDATANDLFDRAHDSLATRHFYDLSIWEPRLARAWKKELTCIFYAKDGNAAKLASDIQAQWDEGTQKKLKIRRIYSTGAELGEAVHIEISDVNNDYRELLKKDFADRIVRQWWFYVDFKGQFFPDNSKITPEAVGKFVATRLAALTDFTGKLLPAVHSEDQVLFRLLGDEKAREAVAQALKNLVASPDNKCLVADEKSVSGKREDKLLAFDLVEDYLSQEKPIFTFYLRKDAKWEDGKPVTGKDIIFTYQTMMDTRIECGHSRNYFKDCESVQLVDNDTYAVRFVWRKPYFDAWTFSAGFQPMAEHIYRYDDPKQFNQGKQNQTLMGNGMYKLDKWERGRQISFVRNENYFGPKPHFKRVVYKVVKDPTVELQLFEAGQTDLNGLTPSQMRAKEKDPQFLEKFDINISVASNYRFIGWNARKPFFKDKQVRQALTMLVDRERVCKTIYRDYAIPQHGTVHPENPAYWKGIEKRAWPYDPAKAKQQLAAAGWKDTDGDGVLDKNGVAFKFTLMFPANSPEIEGVANQVKDSFAQAGIEVALNNLEWSAFLQKIERLQFEACILGWRLGVGEEDPYQLWHSSQTDEKESNFCYFVNKEADRIIEDCRRELNPAKRYAMLHRFQEIILDEQPYTFLMVAKRLVAYDKRIQNVQYRLVGSNQSRWWVPTELQKYKD